MMASGYRHLRTSVTPRVEPSHCLLRLTVPFFLFCTIMARRAYRLPGVKWLAEPIITDITPRKPFSNLERKVEPK